MAVVETEISFTSVRHGSDVLAHIKNQPTHCYVFIISSR